MTDWNSLKVAELKEELAKRDLPVSGKKAELVARLQEHEQQQAALKPDDEAEEAPQAPGGAEGSAEQAPAAEIAVDYGEDDDVDDNAKANEGQHLAHVRPTPTDENAAGKQRSAEASPPAPAQPAAPVEEAIPEEEKKQEPSGAAEQPPKPHPKPDTTAPQQRNQASRPRGMLDAAMKVLDEVAGGGASGGAKRKGDEFPPEARASKHQRAAAAANTGPPSTTPKRDDGASPSRALLIEGFVRPFTLNQARDLLGRHGTVLSMWMPNIKNRAWCVFETRAQAAAAREALWDLQWPAGSPKRLQPKYVPLVQAEAAIASGSGNPDFKVQRTEEDGPEDEVMPQIIESTGKGKARGSAAANAGGGVDASATGGKQDLRDLLSKKRSSDGQEGEKKEETGNREFMSLDDVFKKTIAKPSIYWLPLSEEKAAERRARREKVQDVTHDKTV
jgi:apoptotic chromatin condensation inducer in the nucleus